MAKAIICIGSVSLGGGSNDTPVISYTVAVIGPPFYAYGSDYVVNTSISVANNLIQWRNKIIAQAAERGVVITNADVIVFGAPS